jgi:HK97 family phage major capsid protein
VFGEAILDAWAFKGAIPASVELLQDSGVGLENIIANVLTTQAARGFDKQLVEGDGTTEPQGIFVGFSAGVTAASATFTADNLLSLVYSVGDSYRDSNCSFLIGDTAVGTLRGVKDADGRYLWEPSLTAGVPSTLFGYPVVTDAFVPTVGTGKKSVAFGNFNRGFAVRMVRSAGVEVSSDALFMNGQVAWRIILRGDSEVIDPAAVKLLVHA